MRFGEVVVQNVLEFDDIYAFLLFFRGRSMILVLFSVISAVS